MTKFCPIHKVSINSLTENCPVCEDIRQEEEKVTRFARETIEEYKGGIECEQKTQ